MGQHPTEIILKYNNCIRSIAIGSFDGIHIAHQKLISQAEAVVVIERNGGYLTPGWKRSLYVEKPCFFYHFDKIRSLSPEAFIAMLQEDFPKLEKIVVGYDFAFGKEKAGNAAMLQKLFGANVHIVDEVVFEGISVHSRTIRQYLEAGDIEMANRLLGRTYRIDGSVVSGQGLGGKALVPTVNLKVIQYALPKEGVYATRTFIEGVWRESVSFLGHRVTTDGSFAVETHILDGSVDVQSGSEVWLAFHAFIRENRKFDTLEVLKEQISEDIANAKKSLV